MSEKMRTTWPAPSYDKMWARRDVEMAREFIDQPDMPDDVPLYTRPAPATTNCYECGTPLHGPYCPACRPAPAPQGEDAELIARLRERAARWRGNDNFEDTSLSTANVCEEAADRLAARSAEVAAQIAQNAEERAAHVRMIVRERDRAERAEAALAVKDKALEERDAELDEFMRRLDAQWFLAQNWFPQSVSARAARQAGGDHER